MSDSAAKDTVKVWDPLVRIFHWGLVTCFAVAWFSADVSRSVHHFAGYVAGGLIVFRLIWGIAGPQYARFTQFLRSPGQVVSYLRDMLSGKERRYIGHNPAGGLMVVALILAMGGTALTGWMFTLDAFWGVAWVEDTHGFLANLIVVLVFIHVSGVVLASLRHKENLVHAMLTGRKKRPGYSDVD